MPRYNAERAAADARLEAGQREWIAGSDRNTQPTDPNSASVHGGVQRTYPPPPLAPAPHAYDGVPMGGGGLGTGGPGVGRHPAMVDARTPGVRHGPEMHIVDAKPEQSRRKMVAAIAGGAAVGAVGGAGIGGAVGYHVQQQQGVADETETETGRSVL